MDHDDSMNGGHHTEDGVQQTERRARLIEEMEKIDVSAFPEAARLLEQEIETETSGLDKTKFLEIHDDHPTRVEFRVRIPVKECPQANFVGKLVGPGGSTINSLVEETGCRLAVFGRGSIKDKNKEEDLRKQGGKYAHLNADLHLWIEAGGGPIGHCYSKIGHALSVIQPIIQESMDERGGSDRQGVSRGGGFVARGGRGGMGGRGGNRGGRDGGHQESMLGSFGGGGRGRGGMRGGRDDFRGARGGMAGAPPGLGGPRGGRGMGGRGGPGRGSGAPAQRPSQGFGGGPGQGYSGGPPQRGGGGFRGAPAAPSRGGFGGAMGGRGAGNNGGGWGAPPDRQQPPAQEQYQAEGGADYDYGASNAGGYDNSYQSGVGEDQGGYAEPAGYAAAPDNSESYGGYEYAPPAAEAAAPAYETGYGSGGWGEDNSGSAGGGYGKAPPPSRGGNAGSYRTRPY